MKGMVNKVIREIISIDKEKCNGCGLCINACHEGALRLIDGKAELISDSYCDGLGNCLPECPTGAIQIVRREADKFDEEAVKARMDSAKKESAACGSAPGGCPSSHAISFDKTPKPSATQAACMQSELRQWPVQIKLAPTNAPFFDNAKLLIAADCTAYAHPNIHSMMRNKITLIGCPKLDEIDYSVKLSEILKHNNIESITIVRMEVPCCGGIVNAVKTALLNSGKLIPWNVITIATSGEIID